MKFGEIKNTIVFNIDRPRSIIPIGNTFNTFVPSPPHPVTKEFWKMCLQQTFQNFSHENNLNSFVNRYFPLRFFYNQN